MKKLIAAALLGLLAAFIIADLAKNDNKTSEPTTTTTGPGYTYIDPPTTSTTEDNSAEKAFCLQKASEIGDLYGQYAALLPSITTMAEAQAALETGRALASASNAWLTRCGSYFPTQAAEIRASLAEFEATLDQLEALL